MSLYTARLWSSEAPPAWSQPFALELTYRRALSRDTLVEASLDEMRRLGGANLDEATLQRWSAEMREAFVDVQPGMRITGVYLPGKGCMFYVDDRLHRQVPDARFARAFFRHLARPAGARSTVAPTPAGAGRSCCIGAF